MTASESRFPALDSIRGFGFLLVLASHIGNARNLPTRGLGQFGVWIFFVLSAFLLSLPFFSKPENAKSAGEWAIYFVRRILRIYPPLFAALLVLHYCDGLEWPMVGRNLLFERADGILWTVFIEVRYYLLLPLVVGFLIFYSGRPKIIAVIAAVAFSIHLWDAPFWQIPAIWRASGIGTPNNHTFFQYLPLFVAGALLAWVCTQAKRSALWTNRLNKVGPGCVVASVIALVVASPAGLSVITRHDLPLSYYHSFWTPMLPIAGSLVFFPVFTGGFVGAILNHSIARFFGKISYSGYLFHNTFVTHFSGIERTWLYLICVVAASIVAATIGHFLLERPFIRLGHRLQFLPKPT